MFVGDRFSIVERLLLKTTGKARNNSRLNLEGGSTVVFSIRQKNTV
jgi:hypothetical protein